jgi:hypothetical protein
MAVRGEWVERHVAQHAKTGQCLFQRGDGATDEVFGVDRLVPLRVLQRRIDRRKHGDGRNAERRGLARGIDERRDRQAERVGHRRHRRPPVPVMHEYRPDQVAGGQHALGDQFARPRIAAVAAQTARRVRRERRQERLIEMTTGIHVQRDGLRLSGYLLHIRPYRDVLNGLAVPSLR